MGSVPVHFALDRCITRKGSRQRLPVSLTLASKPRKVFGMSGKWRSMIPVSVHSKTNRGLDAEADGTGSLCWQRCVMFRTDSIGGTTTNCSVDGLP